MQASVSSSTVPLIAGFSGGLVSTTLLLPLDVVKLRMQVTESSKPHKRFRFFRIAGGIVKYEGIRGLYVGWSPAVIGAAVSWGGYFYFYENLKQRLVEFKLRKKKDESYLPTEVVSSPNQIPASAVLNSFDNFVLACVSGAIMVAMTNPVWLVKTRMQLQMRKASAQHHIKPYANMVDAFRTIIREEGALALYKGSGPALLLTSHGGVQFVVYEYLRKHFNYKRLSREEGSSMNVWQRLEHSSGYLAMGAVAKLAATTVTYPIQLIKSRMQQRSDSVELTDDGQIRAVRREYRGLTATARKIFINEGISGFFKGCIPNAIRVAPGAAVTFVVYEEVSDFLTVRH